MTINSKNKGSAFERQVAKELSLWLTDGEREDTLWRSSQSGGRHTTLTYKGRDASSQAGDLSSIDRESHDFIETFLVECKHYKNLELPSLFFGGKRGIGQFYQKALKDAKEINKMPLLIAKQNFQPIIVATTAKGYKRLFKSNTHKIATFHKKNMVVVFYEDLLKHGEF